MSPSEQASDPGPDADGEIAYSDYAARSRVTQQHLLDTAVEVLIEHGYSGASTLKIQQRAGVSRGRLLHQYPHRDALLVAAVQHIAEGRVLATHSSSGWPTEPAERVRAAIRSMWSTYHQGYFWAATELWLAARQNTALAEALRPREHALGAAIREAVDQLFGPEVTAHPRYSSLREVLNSSMRGVALTYSFDPRDPEVDTYLTTWTNLALRELDLLT
ncbi:TetR/AcrR family transcriptional regulator [Aeromicrobium sp. Leaf350]|uniref:TetR/AcrR family transcriptional regulator n=1 Tax=Aeromicrobium sp. Leaf350 TaxID=2876565 RepID=UPI001E291B05|nr:TetR/AcrR family transcriptional regulator [Aeromicrobium sp. Leaf350]